MPVFDTESCAEECNLVSIPTQNAIGSTKKSQLINKLYIHTKRFVAYAYAVGEYIVIENIDTTQGISKNHISQMKGQYVVKVVLGT